MGYTDRGLEVMGQEGNNANRYYATASSYESSHGYD